MALLYLEPVIRAIDANGNPMSGAKLYFYLTGTTTPTDTYTSSTLGTPNTNPVVSDSGGLFGAIYLDPAITYRVKFTTSAGTGSTLKDIDPFIVGPAAATQGQVNAGSGSGYVTATTLSGASSTVVNTILGYTAANKAGDTMTDLRLAYGSTLYTDQAGTRTIPVVTLDSTTDLLETHTGGMVRHTSGSTHTWTIQPMATAGSQWVIGSAMVLRNINATVTLARGAGVVLRSAGSATDANKSLAQWAEANLVMEANDTWVISGTGVS